MFSKEQKARSKRNVRHRCAVCGRVRYDDFMIRYIRICYGQKQIVKTRFGHEVWYCSDSPQCAEAMEGYIPY